MKYGLMSGILWGIDTVILGIALGMVPFVGAAEATVASAFMHDATCAILLFIFMDVRGRLRDTAAALKTRSGKVVVLGALMGGPLGMSGYLLAIGNIGAGYTAAISAFYPAFGAFLSYIFLKERITPKQIAALFVALLGIMVMGWSSASADVPGDPLLGILGVLVCVIGWGSEAVILAWGMKDDSVDNETALQIRETSSALMYAIAIVPLTDSYGLVFRALPTASNLVLIVSALAGTTSYLFYYKGIDAIGPAKAMALNISYSAWAVVFGALTGAIPGPLEIVCCIVIICGTVLSATPDWKAILSPSR